MHYWICFSQKGCLAAKYCYIKAFECFKIRNEKMTVNENRIIEALKKAVFADIQRKKRVLYGIIG